MPEMELDEKALLMAEHMFRNDYWNEGRGIGEAMAAAIRVYLREAGLVSVPAIGEGE